MHYKGVKLRELSGTKFLKLSKGVKLIQQLMNPWIIKDDGLKTTKG